MSLWDPNVIPTELDANGINPRVGRDKADPIPVDPATGVLAHEWNVVKSALPWLHTKIGTEDAPAFDSLRGKLAGDTLIWIEPFTDAVVGSHRFTPITGAPVKLTGPRGGWSFALDDAGGIDARSNYFFTRAQTPYWRARYTLTGNPAVNFLVEFIDGAGNEGWGIKFLTAGLKIQGFTRTAGVDTDVDAGVWVANTEVLVEMAVIANVLWLSINGGTAQNCGPAPAGSMALYLYAPLGGAAGTVAEVRCGLLLADWS